jgi:hypothetical protein
MTFTLLKSRQEDKTNIAKLICYEYFYTWLRIGTGEELLWIQY